MSKGRDILHKLFTSNSTNGHWLVMLRIGAALGLMGKIVSEWPYICLLYGSDGLVPKDIALFSQNAYIPTLYSVFCHLSGICTEGAFLKGFFLIHLIFAVILLIGYKARWSAFVCWAMMVIVFNSTHLTSYGFDAVLLSLLFYCLIFPVGHYDSVGSMSKSFTGHESLIRIFHKTIQLHVCLIYLANGISKMNGVGWHDGSGLWDAIHQPQFQSVLTPFLKRLLMIGPVPVVLSLSVVVIEIAYPFLIWVRKVNVMVFALILMLHISIAAVMGLWLFGFVMIVLNFTAFGHVLRRENRNA